MKLLGTLPCDDAEARSLIGQALAHLQNNRVYAAIEHLESAALCATAPQLGELFDTLCTLYLRTNQYAKLARLLDAASELTPPLAIGALLVERNRRQGLELPDIRALPPFKERLATLVRFIGEARYSMDELCVVCSLLTQLGEAATAVPLLDALVDLSAQQHGGNDALDEELVVAVLTLALDRKLKREALALADKLATLSPDWQRRALRYRILMGKAATTDLAPGQDKVVDFLNTLPGRIAHGR